MELKDNEYFLYKEKTFPFLKVPWGWKYALTSNGISKDEANYLGRVIGSLEEVLEHIETEKDEKVVLLTNPHYQGEFIVEGIHAEFYQHLERGVSEKILKKAVLHLDEKGMRSKSKIESFSLRYFTKKNSD